MNTISLLSPSVKTNTLNLQPTLEQVSKILPERAASPPPSKPIRAATVLEMSDKDLGWISIINPHLAKSKNPNVGLSEDIAKYEIPKYLDDETLNNLSSVNRAWEKMVAPYFQKILENWENSSLANRLQVSSQKSPRLKVYYLHSQEVQQGLESLKSFSIHVKPSLIPFKSLPTWVEDTNFLLFYNTLELNNKPKFNREEDVHANARRLRGWMKESPGLVDFEEMNLRHTTLTHLPKEISVFTELKSLNLSNNQLIYLPESIGELTKLRKLNLRKNELSFLPPSLANLALEELDLSHNKLHSFPNALLELANLIKLNLSQNQLSSLPETFCQFKSIMQLNLSHNQLKSLPDTFTKNHVSRLNVEHNQLSSLPQSIGECKTLQWLFIGHNQLTSLPDSLGQLTELDTLSLNNNALCSLPACIQELTQLNSLLACNTKLSKLPDFILDLPLTQLDLSHNELNSLPDLNVNRRLHSLNLSHNHLSSLPPSLENLPWWCTLKIEGNPLDLPSPKRVKRQHDKQ